VKYYRHVQVYDSRRRRVSRFGIQRRLQIHKQRVLCNNNNNNNNKTFKMYTRVGNENCGKNNLTLTIDIASNRYDT